MTTKEKILDSALALFAEQGVDKTSTAAIAKHAGVASGTIFVHFETKEDLIQQLYLQMKQKVMSELAQMLQEEKNEQSVEQTCKRLFTHTITHLLENPKKFAFVQQVEHNPAHNICRQKEACTQEGMVHFFASAMQHGMLREIDVELLHKILWGLFEAIVSHYQKHNIQTVQPEHVDMIYSTIQKKQ